LSPRSPYTTLFRSPVIEADLSDPGLSELIGEDHYHTLCDDVELLDGAGYEFDADAVRHGRLSPVFFGSALTNFGVEPLLKEFLRLTPPPLPREADVGAIRSEERQVGRVGAARRAT